MTYISVDLKCRIRRQAQNRCGYCLFPQELAGTKLEFDHLLPEAKGGKTTEENLWLSCRECNKNKSKQTRGIDLTTGKRVLLFNPRRQNWKRHFRFTEDYLFIKGRTICGRATVDALKLNNFYLATAREFWVKAGYYPPEEFRK